MCDDLGPIDRFSLSQEGRQAGLRGFNFSDHPNYDLIKRGPMDTSTVERVLAYLCDDLGGDWLIAGGALVRLCFDANRGTEDLDLLRIRHAELSDEASRNALYQWLMKHQSGPEWVNNALEPFVREVPSWEKEMILLRKGTQGSVYRPNLTLFVYLKLRRASEVDLKDIQIAIPKCPEGFSERKFLSWANQNLKDRFFGLRNQLGL